MEKTEALNFLSALWPFIGIVFLIVLGVLLLNQQFQKKLYRQKLDQEKLKASHQFELLQTSIAVQEDERKRIARDLHDELGAALSMARMHLVQLEQQNSSANTEMAARLQNVKRMMENALASTRRISHELMPPQLESFGLLQTLESTASEINKTGALKIEIISAVTIPALQLQTELGLYRVCMELINNTIRHAQANSITIRLQTDTENILLDYRDNGKGIPVTEFKKGMGLLSIETRIHSLGGKFTLVNGNPSGIQFAAIIPLNKNHPDTLENDA